MATLKNLDAAVDEIRPYFRPSEYIVCYFCDDLTWEEQEEIRKANPDVFIIFKYVHIELEKDHEGKWCVGDWWIG